MTTTLVKWLQEEYPDVLAGLLKKDINVIGQLLRWLYVYIRHQEPRKVNNTNIYHKIEDKALLEMILFRFRDR